MLYQHFQNWIEEFSKVEKKIVEKMALTIFHKSIAKNTIWLTGIGKSGLIAEYFCRMLQSVGITSQILDPLNSLHGDIGALNRDDLLIFISKGGRNQEFINVIKAARYRGIGCQAVSCQENSPLVEEISALESYILPNPVEDNQWNVLPTTSVLCFHYFFMVVLHKIIEYKGLTREEYYHYHPRGAIGELLQHRVGDIMKPLPKERLHPESTLKEALIYLTTHRLACCLLLDENERLIGLFSDRDIRECLLSKDDPLSQPIRSIAHSAEITTHPETELASFVKKIDQVQLKYLSGIPVITEGRVVGFINHKILLKHCSHLLK